MPALLTKDAGDWSKALAWVTAAEAKAVLTALEKSTSENDWRKAFAFNQPYGVEGISPELIRGELYTEVGDPPTLVLADPLYMTAVMEKLVPLVHIEATRLAGENKHAEAIAVLTNLAWFGRQLVDRQFVYEVRNGFWIMRSALERIRDVAYADCTGPRVLTPEQLTNAIKRLQERDAFFDLDRIKYPAGDRIAAEQMMERLYGGGTLDAALFGRTMAKLGTSSRPLRLFGEASGWADKAKVQPMKRDAVAKTAGIFDDLERRWKMDYFDKSQDIPTAMELIDTSKEAVVHRSVNPDAMTLRVLRQQVRIEALGTRSALAVLGTWYARKSIPPQLSAVRPRFLAELEPDPFDRPELRGAARKPLEYFVPMRDTPKDAAGNPQPHRVNIISMGPTSRVNLTVNLRDDNFVLYSVGTDETPNLARNIENTTALVSGADYMIWPPVVSLTRQHLIDNGQLK
jgi:hypothetical protein